MRAAADAEMIEYRSASAAIPPMAQAVVDQVYPSRPMVRPDCSSSSNSLFLLPCEASTEMQTSDNELTQTVSQTLWKPRPELDIDLYPDYPSPGNSEYGGRLVG